ncbi:MAG: hypothetical protein IJ272_02105 [Clostridia bacterium]|nr:hypothetical protein [Clostridia bacterium]
MKKAWDDVKSFATITMTCAMIALLFIPYDVNKEILMIFSSAYGSIITYFFNRKSNDKEEK